MKTNACHIILQVIVTGILLVSGGCNEGDSPYAPPPKYFILMSDTELKSGNPELEKDFSTVSFSVRNDSLYMSVNNFEKPCGPDMIVDGMIIKYDDGNSGGLHIFFYDLDKEPESYSYHSLTCRLDYPLNLKYKQKYKCHFVFSYSSPQWESGTQTYPPKNISIGRDLEIGEGETVEWKVDKLCLENVLKQPDE